MRFLNHNNQEFLIAHMQGSSRFEHTPILLHVWHKEFNIPENIQLVTFATKNLKSPMLITQLNNINQSYINAAEDVEEWNNTLKIPLTINALKDTDKEYSLILDSSDVVIMNDLSDIFKKFHNYNKKVLFGATKNNYPLVKIDKVQYRDWFGNFCFLNAGTSFGRTADLLKFYQLAEEKRKTVPNPYNSEQFIIRHAFDEYKDTVGFDYKCSIFQTFSKVEFMETEKDGEHEVVYT